MDSLKAKTEELIDTKRLVVDKPLVQAIPMKTGLAQKQTPRWLQFIFLLLLTAAAFANAPEPRRVSLHSNLRWQFQFDAANRLTNTTSPLTSETRISYDNRGLLKAVREPSGETTTNSYDANPSTRFTVSLDGVSGASPYSQFMSAAQQGLGRGAVEGNRLNWEMGQIYQAGRQSTVNFIQGGQPVPNPFH